MLLTCSFLARVDYCFHAKWNKSCVMFLIERLHSPFSFFDWYLGQRIRNTRLKLLVGELFIGCRLVSLISGLLVSFTIGALSGELKQCHYY